MRAVLEAEWDAVLDRMGHDPCPGVVLRSDVEIRPESGHGPRLHAAVYEPEKRPNGPRPAVLGFHGGGFVTGEPHSMGALAKTLALSLGIVTVSASYRLGSEQDPTGLGILEDAAWSWRYVRENASLLGIDPERVAVAGESAGVLLAGHLAVGSPLVEAGMGGGRPAALYAVWGPVDLVARWYD
ncbi:MAG: alpha/beta hydrolase, partial [Fimbriimonadaceae bacterium]